VGLLPVTSKTSQKEPTSENWLISNRDNHAVFCLFHKTPNRDDFYNDLVRYHPYLVKKIYTALGLPVGIPIQ
jgi:hypothetical protein